MWRPFDNGETVGRKGSEGGTVVRDEEHDLGARATLERNCQNAPWAVTCGIYGCFLHTRLLGSEAEAEFPAMLDELAAILESMPHTDAPESDAKREAVHESLDRFVARFP